MSKNKNIRVLVVEDDYLIRDTLNDVFEAFPGFEPVTFEGERGCGDGECAMKALHNDDNIDVILLDLKMPRVSGNEFIKIASQSPNDFPPIIVVSSYIDSIIVDQVLNSGVVKHYFTKPFVIEEIIAYLRKEFNN
jgi:CheY-like chemotaxis protein